MLTANPQVVGMWEKHELLVMDCTSYGCSWACDPHPTNPLHTHTQAHCQGSKANCAWNSWAVGSKVVKNRRHPPPPTSVTNLVSESSCGSWQRSDSWEGTGKAQGEGWEGGDELCLQAPGSGRKCWKGPWNPCHAFLSPGLFPPVSIHLSMFWSFDRLVHLRCGAFLDFIRRRNSSHPSCLKSHGQRSLVGYSPWGHKDSDVT